MMNNVSISLGEGHPENPARCAGENAAAGIRASSGSSLITIPNPDVAGVFHFSPAKPDSTGPDCTPHAAGAGRSAADSWRVAVHEAGHVLIHRILNHEICGVTI